MYAKHLDGATNRVRLPALVTALLIALVFSFVPASISQAATITVVNLNDSGAGSLRQAITSSAAGGTIVFDPALNGGTILLTTSGLTINKNLTIAGPGPNNLTISGNGKYRPFNISSGRVVSISGLSIVNGYVNLLRGAGINNLGTLTIDNCVISGNKMAGIAGRLLTWGGVGIYNSGKLTIRNSTISNNSDITISAGGGGIFNDGTLVLEDSVVSNNQVHSNSFFGQYGGAGICNRGTATISRSNISGNTAIGFSYGGGAGIYNDETLTVSHSTIQANRSVRVSAKTAEGGYGGGIMNWQPGLAIVDHSSIAGNLADRDGGGIENTGTLTITMSSITSNTANALNLGKQAGYGGAGIDNTTGILDLVNTTIDGNQSARYGGGILCDEGALNLSYATVGHNRAAASGGGLYVTGLVTQTAVSLTASIIAYSSGQDCVAPGAALTNNATLIADATCGATLSGDPLLDPLQNNGGETQTLALQPGSPALDLVPPGTNGCGDIVALDQRDMPRPQGAGCDLGAFERQP